MLPESNHGFQTAFIFIARQFCIDEKSFCYYNANRSILRQKLIRLCRQEGKDKGKRRFGNNYEDSRKWNQYGADLRKRKACIPESLLL